MQKKIGLVFFSVLCEPFAPSAFKTESAPVFIAAYAVNTPASGLFGLKIWRAKHFQPLQIHKRKLAAVATHLARGRKRCAHRRALRSAEDFAAQIVVQLNAAHTRRFAMGHAGDGGADAWGDAAGGAGGAAEHGVARFLIAYCAGNLWAVANLCRRRTKLLSEQGANDWNLFHLQLPQRQPPRSLDRVQR